MKSRGSSEWPLIGLVFGGLALGLGVGWLLFQPDFSLAPTSPTSTSGISGAGAPLFATLPAPAKVSSAPAPVARAPAPDFTLKTLDGDQVTLSALRSQPVLINFWASWCLPCRVEMPDLVRAYEAHKAEGFVLLGVNATFLDTRSDAEAFVKEFGMTFPALLDDTGDVSEGLYRLRGLPMSVFVQRDGVIARVNLGAMSADQIDQYLGEILR